MPPSGIPDPLIYREITCDLLQAIFRFPDFNDHSEHLGQLKHDVLETIHGRLSEKWARKPDDPGKYITMLII